MNSDKAQNITMQMLNIILSFILMSVSTLSYGVIYTEITSSDRISRDAANYHYIITQWDYEDPTPNPCYLNMSCTVGVNHRHNASGTGGIFSLRWSTSAKGGALCVARAFTIGELGKCLAETPATFTYAPEVRRPLTMPFTGIAVHNGSVVTQECVGIFWVSPSNERGGQLLPGSVCGLAPPPVGACGMPDSIMIDHGNVSAGDINGNLAKTNIFIDCNQAISGRLFLQGMTNNQLPLGDGISSTIAINGSAIQSTGIRIPLIAGANPVIISSTLSALGKITAGEHKGQGILILTLD